MKQLFILSIVVLIGFHPAYAEDRWNYKQEFLPVLVQAVPGILRSEQGTSGRFGSGIWISADQTVIYTLAVAWAFKDENNPYYHDPKLLEVIMRGGDVLAQTHDKLGRWMFQKKDGSKWGMHFNPWMYSRWIRTYSLIRDAMPAERRAHWQKSLELGFTGIAKSELGTIHNIPTHQAMGLFFAGKAMNRPEWCEKAAAFLGRVADAQDKNGFWSEHVGPVVAYNFVYVDAIGTYYAVSRDERVRDALESAARFHANFTYPDGTNIETVDERNPHLARVRVPNVGFSFSDIGRGYIRQQWLRMTPAQKADSVDLIASLLLYGEEGETAKAPGSGGDSTFIMEDGRASVINNGPWCAVFSAYACPVYKSRWIEDRQNLISIFHKDAGLILGGGNTKLQPLWSTFTVGNTTLLKHKPGDENPDFTPPAGLNHVPSKADLKKDGQLLHLRYGATSCNVEVKFSANAVHLIYTAENSTNSVEGHVPFLPAVGTGWRTASGKSGTLGEAQLKLSSAETGAWFEHNGWRVELPKQSTLTWPVLPHNPYRKDGHAEVSEGRIVITLPFGKDIGKQEIMVTVLGK